MWNVMTVYLYEHYISPNCGRPGRRAGDGSVGGTVGIIGGISGTRQLSIYINFNIYKFVAKFY